MTVYHALRNKHLVWSVMAATVFFCLIFPSQRISAAGERVKLPSGTVIACSLETTVTSDMNPGSSVSLRVIRDVVVNGFTVVRAGAPAIGTVADASSSGIVGQAGRVTVNVQGVQAVDGQQIFVRGSLSAKGSDKTALSIILALICLPLILISGGDGTIGQGTEVRAYTEQEHTVSMP